MESLVPKDTPDLHRHRGSVSSPVMLHVLIVGVYLLKRSENLRHATLGISIGSVILKLELRAGRQQTRKYELNYHIVQMIPPAQLTPPGQERQLKAICRLSTANLHHVPTLRSEYMFGAHEIPKSG